MRFRTRLTALVSILVVVALVAPAAAQNRPDIPDVSTSGIDSSKSPTQFATLDFAFLSGSGFTVFQGASLRRFISNTKGIGFAIFRLYEPDKVTRKSNLALMKQGAYGSLNFLQAITTGTTVSIGAGPLAGCKAQVNLKDKDKNGSLESAKWNATCNKDALVAAGLTDAQIKAVKKLFGGTLIKGKAIVP